VLHRAQNHSTRGSDKLATIEKYKLPKTQSEDLGSEMYLLPRGLHIVMPTTYPTAIRLERFLLPSSHLVLVKIETAAGIPIASDMRSASHLPGVYLRKYFKIVTMAAIAPGSPTPKPTPRAMFLSV
jgi:hypothetical protein